MTEKTHRDYIKPMLLGIAFMVVVLFCLLGTIRALESIGAGQFAGLDSIFNGSFCFKPFGMFLRISFKGFGLNGFTILCPAVFFVVFGLSHFTLFCFGALLLGSPTCLLAFFSFCVFGILFQITYFALISVAIAVSFCFVKFRNRFSLLARSAGFRYGCLRHNLLLTRRLCLEPNALPVRVSGLFYNNRLRGKSKYFLENLSVTTPWRSGLPISA